MGVCLSATTKSETTPPSGTRLPEMSIDHSPGREDQILQSSNLKSFSFSDLQMITRNFRTDSAVEEGGFGSVFKGWLDENSLAATKPGTGMAVAVKKLHQTYHGHKEWLAEVNYLGQFSHPNLVRLIGYCLEDDQRLLVHEFVPRGSLENHLFRRGSYFQPICWSLRLKVALGAAKGLAFLHSSEAQIICRDFKTSNILLDLDYNAKLSDYGMARDGVMGDSKSHGSLLGTYGYAAPEDLANGCRTSKSDVYGFGVILLELMSGRRAIDKNRPSGEHKLVEWAKPYLANERKVVRIMDNRLEGQYRVEAVQKVAGLAVLCVSLEPKLRLRMDDVVRELEQLQEHMNDTVVRGKSRHRRRSAGDVAGIKVIANAVAAAAANNTVPSIDFKQR